MNKNNNSVEEILSDFKHISLTEAERLAMFSRIDQYVADNPRIKTSAKRPVASPYFSWSFFAVHTKGFAFAMVVFIILGSTSAAAQYALPGEILYTVKVNINEEVRSLFAPGEVAKAKFESKRANERLKEASVLARNGKLSSAAKEEIEVKFSKHISVVQENVRKLKNEGNLNEALAVGTDLEVTLRSSEDELSGISAEGTVTDDTQVDVTDEEEVTHLSELVLAVAEEIEKTSVTRQETEVTISDTNNNETIKIAAETKRDAAIKMLALLEEDRPSHDIVDSIAPARNIDVEKPEIRTKGSANLMMMAAPVQSEEEIIAQIKVYMEEGEKFLANNQFKEAFDSFNAAFELENSLYIQSSKEIPDITEVIPEVKGEQTTTTEEGLEVEVNIIPSFRFDKEKELD